MFKKERFRASQEKNVNFSEKRPSKLAFKPRFGIQKGFYTFMFVLLMLVIIPGVNAIKLEMVKNTEPCIYQDNDMDYCETIYKISDIDDINASKLKFLYRRARHLGYFDGLSELKNLNIEKKKIGSDFYVNISAYKPFWEDIDNVPCYDRDCWYQYTWWNASRPYYLEIKANFTDGMNLIEYPIFLNITYSFLNNTCRSDFEDIWFYNSTEIGYSKVNYCMGSDCIADNSTDMNESSECINASYCEFFVRFPKINGSVFMSWGDNTSINYSNPHATFQLFDDFEDDSKNTSLWNQGCSSFLETGGKLIGGGGGVSICGSDQFIERPLIIESFFRTPSTSQHSVTNVLRSTSHEWNGVYFDTSSGNRCIIFGWDGSANYPLLFTGWSSSTWYNVRAFHTNIINSTGWGEVRLLNGTVYSQPQVSNRTDIIGISCMAYSSSTPAWEWIRARKYHEPQPIITFGNVTYNITPTETPIPNITMEYEIQFCYDADYLYIKTKDASENGTSVFNEYLKYCDYGCDNYTWITLGYPSCKESPMQLLIIESVIVIVFIMIIIKVKL